MKKYFSVAIAKPLNDVYRGVYFISVPAIWNKIDFVPYGREFKKCSKMNLVTFYKKPKIWKDSPYWLYLNTEEIKS